jgi:hypothetical protein
MIKPMGQHIPVSFYNKKVLVTNSCYYAYKKGDVYLIDDVGWVFKQEGRDWVKMYFSGYDAELTIINLEEQLDFNF